MTPGDHPAGLASAPTTPSRRRVRGDGSGGGPARAGAIAAGLPVLHFPYPRERRRKMQERSTREQNKKRPEWAKWRKNTGAGGKGH